MGRRGRREERKQGVERKGRLGEKNLKDGDRKEKEREGEMET